MSLDCDTDAAPLGFAKRQKHRLGTRARLLCLDDLDGRTRAAANCQRMIAGIQADIGTDLSTSQVVLSQRAAILSAIAEHAETQWLLGMPIVISDYNAVVNSLRRVLETLGLERHSKVINGQDSDAALTAELLSYLRPDPEGEGDSEAVAAS